MPTVGLKPFFGSVLDLKDSQNMYKLSIDCVNNFNQYPYFILWHFTQPYVVLIHPDVFEIVCTSTSCTTKNYMHTVDWIGDGLICSAGEKWKKHRRYLTGLFHQDNLQSFVTVFNAHGKMLTDYIQSQNGKEFDFLKTISNITFKTLLSTLMGLSEDDHIVSEEMKETYLETVKNLLELMMLDGFQKNVFGKWISSWTKIGQEYQKEIQKSNDFTKSVLKEKAKIFSAENRKNCLIDVLLELKFKDNLITEEEILDELNTFMFAGFSTTSAALSWIMHHVAFRPEVQKKLQMELKANANLYKTDNDIFIKSISDLNKFPYLDAVIKESQRFLATVPLTSRFVDENTHIRLPKPVSLDECSVKDADLTDELPYGSTIVLQYISMHRNKRIWGPDADEFKPERFLPENSKSRSPFAFIPFSAGARNCIGQQFAKLEMKIFLIHLFTRFCFSTSQDDDACDPFVSASLEPRKGVIVQAVKNET